MIRSKKDAKELLEKCHSVCWFDDNRQRVEIIRRPGGQFFVSVDSTDTFKISNLETVVSLVWKYRKNIRLAFEMSYPKFG